MQKIKYISRKAYDFIFENRIRLSFLIAFIFITEDILEKIHPHDIDSLKDIMGLTGLFLVTGGNFVRSWAAGVLNKGKELQTNGPYAWTRHPLYIGSLLIAIGFCIIIGDKENIWVVIFLALFVYIPKARKEETVLENRFGKKWIKYKSHTPIISLRGFKKATFSDWSIHQWIYNKEYNAFAASIIILVTLEFTNRFLFKI